MADIADSDGLKSWLKGKAPELAWILAARAALRVAPVLGYALREDAQSRRRVIVLAGFRALAVASAASAWPGHVEEIRKAARAAAQAIKEVSGVADGARLNVVDWREAAPEEHVFIQDAEADARVLGIVEHAVDAVAHAVRAVVDLADVGRGIASPVSVYEAAVQAIAVACRAAEEIHGQEGFFNGTREGDAAETNVVDHVAEIWNAVKLDVDWLETGTSAGAEPAELVANSLQRALWLDGVPVWASRLWQDFEDGLPDEEGWRVWTDWYVARLVGRTAEVSLELDLLNIPSDDWEQGPAHVNAVIAKLIESHADPLLVAVLRGFEDLDAVKQVSSIDLTRYTDRIRNALPNDPYQAIGATKDMLEATMKTILHRRGHEETYDDFPTLTKRCLSELGLLGTSEPATEGERHSGKIEVSCPNCAEYRASDGHPWCRRTQRYPRGHREADCSTVTES